MLHLHQRGFAKHSISSENARRIGYRHCSQPRRANDLTFCARHPSSPLGASLGGTGVYSGHRALVYQSRIRRSMVNTSATSGRYSMLPRQLFLSDLCATRHVCRVRDARPASRTSHAARTNHRRRCGFPFPVSRFYMHKHHALWRRTGQRTFRADHVSIADSHVHLNL